eukprot:GFKZ01007822.1.p1 GENE.GFKZ01007822.1~~GFKZ01007822.1.p1  ORF type:complete len:314 (+),score=43.81 GFKZ01007822.1:223-1164(+)
MKLRSSKSANSPYVRYALFIGVVLLLIDVLIKLSALSAPTAPTSAPADLRPLSVSGVEGDMGNAMSPSGNQEACQEFILYYKPPKTGSTALTDAARMYVSKMGHADYRCGMLSCGPYADGVCEGRLEPRHLLGHLSSNYSVVECLKKRNYYVVTSNREPVERWQSAYRYNIQHRKTHYGIPWTVSYLEWMSRVPECVLLNYYDGLGRQCGDEKEVDERIKNIVGIVDEVVDLYDKTHDQGLGAAVVPYLGESNVSDVGNRTIEYPDLPEEIDRRLNAERKLWKALKERAKQPPAAGRKLCVRDIKKVEEDVEG